MITAFALHYPVSIKKAVSICLSAREGVEALVHKQETPTAYNGEAYSLFYVHSNFSTFLQHKNQLNAFSLICKIIVVFTTAQIYKKLAHIRMDFAGIMQTIGIKGRYVGFTYIRPLYGFAPFWRS